MPNVKDCSSTFNVPPDGYNRSGNMVGVPGDEKNTFNIMEMSGVDDNFFKMLNIPIVQGSFFTKEMTAADRLSLMNEVQKTHQTWHWKDGVVGLLPRDMITISYHLWCVQEYSLGAGKPGVMVWMNFLICISIQPRRPTTCWLSLMN